MSLFEDLKASEEAIKALREAGKDTKEAEAKHHEIHKQFTREAQVAWMEEHLTRMIQ